MQWKWTLRFGSAVKEAVGVRESLCVVEPTLEGVLIRSAIKGVQDGVRVGSANKKSCWSTGDARPGRTNIGVGGGLVDEISH